MLKGMLHFSLVQAPVHAQLENYVSQLIDSYACETKSDAMFVYSVLKRFCKAFVISKALI